MARMARALPGENCSRGSACRSARRGAWRWRPELALARERRAVRSDTSSSVRIEMMHATSCAKRVRCPRSASSNIAASASFSGREVFSNAPENDAKSKCSFHLAAFCPREKSWQRRHDALVPLTQECGQDVFADWRLRLLARDDNSPCRLRHSSSWLLRDGDR